MTAADRLAEIQARADAATCGQWEWEATNPSMAGAKWNLRIAGKPGIRLSVSEYQHGPDNAEFIAHARTDVPRLVATLRAVLDLCDSTPLRFRPHDGAEPFMVLGVPAIRSAIEAALGEGAS